MARSTLWRRLRITALLYLLLLVAVGSWLSARRSTDWNETLWVSVYPANGDGSEVSGRYIGSLGPRAFEPLQEFFSEESAFYELSLEQPVRLTLGPRIQGNPPPAPAGGNPLAVAWWSLRLRWWALRVDKGEAPSADVEIYVRYFDPATHPVLSHSLGLRKGLLGVVNAFASPEYAGSNRVVIAHELLHTLGASDKYDPVTSLPRYPDGLADPQREPLYPQDHAEIMGGRIAVSASEARVPRGLSEVLIGPATALEIRWIH